MPRRPRVEIVGSPHYVIQRGVNRSDIFRGPADYEYFLTVLRYAAAQHQSEVHTYVLMTNHFHCIVTPRVKGALSGTMKKLDETYAGYFNRRYDRTGALYTGRFRSFPIDTERYWFTCMRYVELNPIRAGMVSRPEDYRWSSHRFHALGELNDLIAPHPLYDALGTCAAMRQQCWKAICGEALPAEQLNEMRYLVRHSKPMPR